MLTVSHAGKVRAALEASGTELAGVAITHRGHPARRRDQDHVPVLAELRSLVPSEDLLFLADLSIEPTLAAMAGANSRRPEDEARA